MYYLVEDEPAAMSYRELLERAENIGRWLAVRTRPGDRIGLWSRNTKESVLLQHASGLAGTVIVPFNTSWTDPEVKHALALTGPSMVFTGVDTAGNDLHERLSPLAACPVNRLSDVDPLSCAPSDHPLPRFGQEAPYLIQFTSGTTGKAKAALLSHRAALLGGWLRPHCEGANETDVWLNAVPFHHIGGSCAIVLGALGVGASFVVLARSDREQILRLLKKVAATRMGGVPTMWHDILASPNLPEKVNLRTISLGGASVPPELVRNIKQRLGAKCGIGYGQSECPVVTATLPDDPLEVICDTVGRPLPHTELKIVDPRTGATLPLNEAGEICVRSPLCMNGYWNNPEATLAALDNDGFLHTGDLGSLDEHGYCRIKGRLRELIIRGGENIYPVEVETALLSHPSVDMAAVVGVDHPRLGQEVGAVIKLRRGASADAALLETHVGQLVARFKVPRHWRFVDTMPLTASGKIRKVELQKMFADDQT